MNRQQRYEPLAQREEPILLDPIQIQNYNYNSATPDSVSAPSIKSSRSQSPPPSFHTHSSPGTPRPLHAQPMPIFTHAIVEQPSEHLWGAAPSDETEVGIGSSNDALATIKGLKQRVEWLEESMGRLLLERERYPPTNEPNGGQAHPDRQNCCVSFSDISPDLERSLVANRQNCFVSYNGAKTDARRRDQKLLLFGLLILAFFVCGTIAIGMIAKSGRVNRAVNKTVDGVMKLME